MLLDELGAGTDPVEGACLGIAILEALLERGALIVSTTHLDAIKAYAYSHPRIENGCVEFDLDTLRPLYKLLIGLSGRSHGLAIAARVGLPPNVIQRAERLLGEGRDPLRLLLEQLETEQQRLAIEREALTHEAAETAKRATRPRETGLGKGRGRATVPSGRPTDRGGRRRRSSGDRETPPGV